MEAIAQSDIDLSLGQGESLSSPPLNISVCADGI